jgi:signal transduction histidine kinase
VESLSTWANTKSIHIEKDVQENLPKISMDPNRIIQVLNNLIGNAIKFTPNDGTIKVGARLDRGNNAIEVNVKDNGIGITEENLSRIFDKFYQVGGRVSTDISGTGLGLSIAKEIVELHGGKVWVESKNGYGANFVFTLPLFSDKIP